jgi:hypothetical protein
MATSRARFDHWVQEYLDAWKTNKPDAIAALFTEEATYLTQAFREPWSGREAIVKGWIERAPWQGKWSFDYRWWAVEGSVGVLEGITTYHSQGAQYSNIWVIRLERNGRCSEFREQWVRKRKTRS